MYIHISFILFTANHQHNSVDRFGRMSVKHSGPNKRSAKHFLYVPRLISNFILHKFTDRNIAIIRGKTPPQIQKAVNYLNVLECTLCMILVRFPSPLSSLRTLWMAPN